MTLASPQIMHGQFDSKGKPFKELCLMTYRLIWNALAKSTKVLRGYCEHFT